MEYADVIIGLVSGGGGTGAGLLLGKWMLDRFAAKYDALALKVQRLDEERIAGIEARVDRVSEGCKAHQLNQDLTRLTSDLSNLVGWMKKNDLVLGEIRDTVNGLKASAEADRRWLANLSDSQQRHVTDHSIHGVHKNG